jgi:hypothetical protein
MEGTVTASIRLHATFEFHDRLQSRANVGQSGRQTVSRGDTLMIRGSRALAGFSAMLCFVVSAVGQEVKTQKINARGISFEVPETWKKLPPSSTMRVVELKIEPSKGDSDPGEFVIFAFPWGAGTVQQNVDRWQQQFQDETGKPPKITTEKIQGQGVEVTLVETSGRYVAPIKIGQPERYDKPGYSLVGAIVTTPETGYFIKLIGPSQTIKDSREAFIAMAKSMKIAS